MAGQIDQPVQTFTIGFDDRDGYDERPYARLAATRHGTDHHEFVVHPEAVDLVERLVWHHDQPFGDSAAVPTFLLSEVTRGHVTVALCGDGGDELFAGYERFAAGVAARRYAALPSAVRGAVGAGIGRLPRRGRVQSIQRFAEVGGEGLPTAFRSWISYVKDPERDALLDGRRDDWALDDYAAAWRSSEGAHPLDRLLDLNLRTYLLDDLLVKADRTSMAHALELRSPLLDVELLEFASLLPPRLKARGLSLKRVLRAAVADIVPQEILQRPKRGFGVPLDRWFREDLRSYVRIDAGRPRCEGEGAPGPRRGGSHDRRTRRPRARSRRGALDPALARGLPAPRGLVGNRAMPTSLVTGGAGFLGAHVAGALLDKGHTVVVLDDLSGGFTDNVPSGRCLRAGLGDRRSRSSPRLFDEHGFDYVFHLAAYAAEGLSHFIRRFNYTNNVLGSMTLINEAVRHEVKCFVFTSSIAVYGAEQTPMTEDTTPQPEDPYGIAKLAVEQDLRAAKRMFDLDHVIFRPHNVYGEYQNIGDRYRNVVGIFMNQLMQRGAADGLRRRRADARLQLHRRRRPVRSRRASTCRRPTTRSSTSAPIAPTPSTSSPRA